MWFILQIALGVCGGLWLFWFLLFHPPRIPRITVSSLIAFCAAVILLFWCMHLVLMAFR